jgi:multidrug efflux pump subunit AcrA (membrane-fusion protein)
VEVSLSRDIPLGASVKVRLKNDARPDSPPCPVVPVSAIVTRYGSPGVFVVDKESLAHFRRVTLVSANTTRACVDGLAAGDVVIAAGHDNILDGERVLSSEAR